MAGVQGLGSDALNGLHRSGDGIAQRMVGIQILHHLLKHPALRAIVVHEDLLGDDATLLLHALIGEVRGGDEFQQEPQALGEIVGAGEIIGGHVIAGEGIDIGAQRGEFLVDVPVAGHIEHLVLQIVGHTGGRFHRFAVQGELRMDRAEIRHKIGAFPGKSRFFDDADCQTVGQDLPVHRLVQSGIIGLIHLPTPFRNAVVWSLMVPAHRAQSAAVTASTAAI